MSPTAAGTTSRCPTASTDEALNVSDTCQPPPSPPTRGAADGAGRKAAAPNRKEADIPTACFAIVPHHHQTPGRTPPLSSPSTRPARPPTAAETDRCPPNTPPSEPEGAQPSRGNQTEGCGCGGVPRTPEVPAAAPLAETNRNEVRSASRGCLHRPVDAEPVGDAAPPVVLVAVFEIAQVGCG